MYLLLSKSHSLYTTLDDDRVSDLIQLNLEPKQMARKKHLLLTKDQHKLFEGKFFNYHYNMNVVRYNAFLLNPTLSVRIKKDGFGTSITLNAKIVGLNAAVVFILTLLLFVVSLSGIAGLFSDQPKIGPI